MPIADPTTSSNQAQAGAGTVVRADAIAPTPTPTTSPAEDRLWRWLRNLAVESDQVRKREARLDDFGDYLDLFYGKHWPTSMPSYRPGIVANELRTLVLSEASDLTEAQLRVYITKDPTRKGRDTQAELAFRAIWRREEIDLKLMMACVWSMVCGTGFLDVHWDPDAAHGMGDVVVNVRDPRTVLPDPDAIDDRKWSYVITQTVLDLWEIRRLFPIKGRSVNPEDRWSVREPSATESGPSTAEYTGPLYGEGMFMHESPRGYKKARAEVLDCFVIDDVTEEIAEEIKSPDGTPVLGEDGNPVMRHSVKAKYPNGRRIVGSNGVILLDGDNPYPARDFGTVRVVLEPPIGRFWGTGFLQQTDKIQIAANKMLSSTAENAIRLNAGIIVSTTNTGLDWESFANIPAQIVQINPGSEFNIRYPPPMPADMVQAPYRLLDLQRRILGFPEPRAGIAGRGNISADLTETEISQAQSATRLRARMLHQAVQRLAEMVFARMARGYTTKRHLPAVEGQAYKDVEWEPLDSPEKYSVYVDPASFTVMSRTMLRRLGLMLFRLKAIDRKSLLESLSWPDWQETSDRLDKMEQLAAMAKMKQKKGG